MPRTPKPHAPPTTLTEAVLDLERRMTGGDALSEVLLPAEDWTRLVELAEDDGDPASHYPRNFRPAVCQMLGADEECDDPTIFDALRRIILNESVATMFLNEVRQALGMPEGSLRSDMVDAVRELVAKHGAPTPKGIDAVPPPKKRRERRKRAFCGTCNEDTLHNGDDECAACADKPPADEDQGEDPRQLRIDEEAA